MHSQSTSNDERAQERLNGFAEIILTGYSVLLEEYVHVITHESPLSNDLSKTTTHSPLAPLFQQINHCVCTDLYKLLQLKHRAKSIFCRPTSQRQAFYTPQEQEEIELSISILQDTAEKHCSDSLLQCLPLLKPMLDQSKEAATYSSVISVFVHSFAAIIGTLPLPFTTVLTLHKLYQQHVLNRLPAFFMNSLPTLHHTNGTNRNNNQVIIERILKEYCHHQSIPPIVSAMINLHWKTLIAQSLEQHNMKQCSNQLSILEQLIWSLQLQHLQLQKNEWLRRLPDLIQHIRNQLRFLPSADFDSEHFLSELHDIHCHLLQASQHNALQPSHTQTTAES